MCDSQATNRRQEQLSVRTVPPGTLELVAWELYMPPSQPKYIKNIIKFKCMLLFIVIKISETLFIP
jgi:hypothetical protein